MKKQYRWSVNIYYMFSPILFWFVSASTFLNKSVLLKTNTLVLQISIKSCSTCSVNFHLNKLHFITRSVSVLLLLCFQNQSCILTVVFFVFKTLQGMKIRDEKCICRHSPVMSQGWLKSVLFSSMHHEAIYNLRRNVYHHKVLVWLFFQFRYNFWHCFLSMYLDIRLDKLPLA